MRQITVIGALAALTLTLLGCAAGAGGSIAGAGSSASAGPGPGACRHPFPGDPSVRACSYPEGLYMISYPEVNQYFWRPGPGYFTVTETYYQASAPGRAAGAWPGRSISVGDSCVLDETWTPSLTTPPASCMDSRTGGYRAATREEQQSILKFWAVMTRYVPAGSR